MTDKTEAVALTDRELSVIRRAVWGFMHAAYEQAYEAAQDLKEVRYKKGAAQAFLNDAKEVEVLLGKLDDTAALRESGEPVAWALTYNDEGITETHWGERPPSVQHHNYTLTPLYTTPQPDVDVLRRVRDLVVSVAEGRSRTDSLLDLPERITIAETAVAELDEMLDALERTHKADVGVVMGANERNKD